MSPPATSTLLPQELVDTVIDELKEDVGSLRACSLVSKPWVYRSRKHLFATVNLPTFLLRRWQVRVPANSEEPLDPHQHVRSLSLYPATPSAAFGIPETFIDHLSSFHQVSTLTITSSLWEEWTDAFSDGPLVARYFGGFGRALRKLELARVYLNMVALKALLGVFPQLDEILIFSPIMVNDEARSVEAFPHLREHRSITKAEEPPNAVEPCELAPIRFVDIVTLIFPPKDLVVALSKLPLRCRELILVEDFHRGGDILNLLFDSTGPTLESLTIRSTLDRGSTATLENCPILRTIKTKAPCDRIPPYIDEQARLIRTVTSPFLGQVVFMGKWDESRMGGTIDWLEPAKWEIVDRELCNLMDRLDEEVKLEVVFTDSDGGEVKGAGCEQAEGAGTVLLNGVRTRGGVVKLQRAEKLR